MDCVVQRGHLLSFPYSLVVVQKQVSYFQTNINFRLIEGKFDHREQIVSRPAAKKTKGARNFRFPGKLSLKLMLQNPLKDIL